MPMMIPADFDRKLTVPVSNRKEAAAFLAATPSNYVIPRYVVSHGYRLLQSKESNAAEGTVRTICLIADGAEPSIAYKVKLITRTSPNQYMIHTNATQLIVWRSIEPQHANVLNGFAATIFEHLLESHNIVISDNEQTDAGKRFWMTRIGAAFANGNHVSYIDLNDLNNDMVPIIKEVQDYNVFMEEYEPIGWGNDQEHKDRVFVISKTKL